MSLKINPSTVHLGKDQNAGPQTPADNQYYANYVPSPPKEEQPPSCLLPPALPIELTEAPLVKIDQSCSYTFPEVIPLPPIFNPPINIPCACETLSYTNNVVIEGGGPGSFLSLIAGGPQNCEGDQPAECNISLTGLITFPIVCESFDVDVNITSSGAAKASSIVGVRNENTGCGVSITGNIDAEACETFSASSQVTTTGALTGSLELVPTSLPNCEVLLIGNLDVKACEQFTATGAIQVGGNAGKGSIQLTSNSAPNCSLNLTGDITVDACVDFTTSGQINITGNAVKSSSISISPQAAPNCGLNITGEAVIDACVLFNVEGNIQTSGTVVKSNTIALTTKPAPECGLVIDGSLDFEEVCTEFKVIGDFGIEGNIVESSDFTIQAKDVPFCGIELSGKTKLKACKDFEVEGTLQFEGDPVESNNITVEGSFTDEVCKLQINGAAKFKYDPEACTSSNFEIQIIKDQFQGAEDMIVKDKMGRDIGGTEIFIDMRVEEIPLLCGKKILYSLLVENLDLNVCEDHELEVDIQNGENARLKIVSGSDVVTETPFSFNMYFENVDECKKKLVYEIQDIELPTPVKISGESARVDTVDGCGEGGEDDGVRIELNQSGEICLLGNLYRPCFTCDQSPSSAWAYSQIELYTLDVGIINAGCCDGGGNGTLDFCLKSFTLGEKFSVDGNDGIITAGTVTISGSDNSITLGGLTIDSETASWKAVTICNGETTETGYVLWKAGGGDA
jgi:hypothetical protein